MFELIMLAGFLAAAVSQMLPEEEPGTPSEREGPRRPAGSKTRAMEVNPRNKGLSEKWERKIRQAKKRRTLNGRFAEERPDMQRALAS